jgi:hypothetical protein
MGRPPRAVKRISVSVRFEPDDILLLDLEAEAQGVTRQEFIETAVVAKCCPLGRDQVLEELVVQRHRFTAAGMTLGAKDMVEAILFMQSRHMRGLPISGD